MSYEPDINMGATGGYVKSADSSRMSQVEWEKSGLRNDNTYNPTSLSTSNKPSNIGGFGNSQAQSQFNRPSTGQNYHKPDTAPAKGPSYYNDNIKERKTNSP